MRFNGFENLGAALAQLSLDLGPISCPGACGKALAEILIGLGLGWLWQGLGLLWWFLAVLPHLLTGIKPGDGTTCRIVGRSVENTVLAMGFLDS